METRAFSPVDLHSQLSRSPVDQLHRGIHQYDGLIKLDSIIEGMKFNLDIEQVRSFVIENRYLPKDQLVSRCVDGRYPNETELAALAIPGGDAGQLAVIYAAANQYGFMVDEQKVLYSLFDVIGGKEKFSFHSDGKNAQGTLGAGCGHLKQMQIDPEAYQLTKEQVDRILTIQIPCAVGYGARQTVLEGEHGEGAALQIQGKYGVYPHSTIETDSGREPVQVFIYHKTFVDERHKILAKKLIEDKAVELYDELDADYLAQVLSETAESHFFETLKRLAKGKPLYNINFKDEMDFTVEEMGEI